MKLTPSDFVDSVGNVFKTIGDNIRNGVRNSKAVSDELSQEFEQEELNNMHVLPFMTGKGKWVLAADTITNGLHNFGKYQVSGYSNEVFFNNNVKYIFSSTKSKSMFSSYRKTAILSLGQSGSENNLMVSFNDSVSSDDNGKIIYFWLWVEEE